MDTIRLRVTESDKTKKLKEKFHEQLLAHAFTQTKVNSYRGIVIAGTFNDVKFSSKFFQGYGEREGWVELEFHTWKIKKYSQLIEWIYLLVGQDKILLEFIIHEMKISRLDFCLDVYAPHNFISSNMYKVGAVVSHKYRSREETTYIGGDEDKFIAYTKKELTVEDSELVISEELNSKKQSYTLQRLEHRIRGRKLPISYLVDFPDLVDFKVFEKLQVLVLSQHGLNKIPEEKKSSFINLLADYGFHQTRKELNVNRNFSRTYGRFFDDHAHLIRHAWEQKIIKYFS